MCKQHCLRYTITKKWKRWNIRFDFNYENSHFNGNIKKNKIQSNFVKNFRNLKFDWILLLKI